MSVSTLIRSGDDFDAWEAELAQSKHRPTRAAERRAGREAIDRGLGIVRHRSRPLCPKSCPRAGRAGSGSLSGPS